MSAFFPSQSRDDYWFRLGRFQMTSTLVVVLLGVVGMLAWVITGGAFTRLAFFQSGAVFSGEVWRIFTWPLTETLGLWSILTLVMLWYFGREVEATIGRNSMAKLFVGSWVSFTAAALILGILLPQGTQLIGLNLVQFAILLLFIAENPRRPFFFGIPAWVLGSVLLALQVFQLLGARMWGELFVLLFGLFGVAIAAKRVGLLTNASVIPGGTTKRRTTTRGPARKKSQQPTRQEKRHVSDEDRMDALLAKISAEGIHSLSKGERAELEKLRQRRRR